MSAGYGYTDAKVRDLADNPYMPTTSSKGKQYAYIPKKHILCFWRLHRIQSVLRELGVNFSTSFQDKVYRNSDNTSSFDAYWLTDLGFSYTLKEQCAPGSQHQ